MRSAEHDRGPAPRAPAAPSPATIRAYLSRWLPWVFLPVALAFLAAQIASILDVASWNADNANMLTLADGRGDDAVNMGNAPLYATLWANQILARLPGHESWLQAVPLAWYAMGALLVTWSLRRATGDWWCALVSATLLVCLAPPTLEIASSFATHGTSWFATCVLGAFAVWAAGERRQRRLTATAIALGLFAGVATATDPLALSVAVLPLLCAWGMLLRLRPRAEWHWAGLAGFVTAASVAYVVTGAAGSADGIAADLPPPTLATVEQMWANVLNAITNATSYLGPAPLGARLDEIGALRLVAGVAGAAGAIVAVVLAWRRLRAEERDHGDGGGSAARRAGLELYWGASVTVSLLFFVVSPLVFEVGRSSARYSLNLFLAGAVALPLALRDHGRRGVLAGSALATLVGVIGIHGLMQAGDRQKAVHASPIVAEAPPAVRAAVAAGATRGYAGYWSASPLTWHTGTRVIPVANCDDGSRKTLCRSPFAVPASQLRGKAGISSFVLIDHSFPGAPEDAYLAALGPFKRRIVVGSVVVLVYPRDVGFRFGPTP